tara:strand:+ start:183 stop:392 length:210 start_codon:yes stop_codon:yes gene_type:complete
MKKELIFQPIKVDENTSLKVEESICDKVSWTAKMPHGELEKLKKVCKPVAMDNGLSIWVLDSDKVNFIQ